MWMRADLKARAKGMMQRCFWLAVAVCFVSTLFTSEFGDSGFNFQNSNTNTSYYSWNGTLDRFYNNDIVERYYTEGSSVSRSIINNLVGVLENIGGVGMLAILFSVGIWLWLLSMAFSIFIGGPLIIGSKRFFMCNRERGSRFEMLLFAFKSGNFMNVAGIMFMVGIKIFLWSLLLVVPGIVKSYEYRMVPYILSENPGIQMNRAFELSREMTYGHKLEIWLLDLSFILWRALGLITCGLADIFYVNPYIAATNAELYGVLRGNVLQKGITNCFELPGFWEA